MKLIPLGNSLEKFVLVKSVDGGFIIQYKRKFQNSWINGKPIFIPIFMANEVLRKELMDT